MTAKPGSVLFEFERKHADYGFERVGLCVNLAGELLIAVETDVEVASTLTRTEAGSLRDALTTYLTEEEP